MEDDGDDSVVGSGGWRISKVFSEFNSAAWGVNIGGEIVLPGFGSGSGAGVGGAQQQKTKNEMRSTRRTKRSATLKRKEEAIADWWLWDEMKY